MLTFKMNGLDDIGDSDVNSVRQRKTGNLTGEQAESALSPSYLFRLVTPLVSSSPSQAQRRVGL